MDQQDKQDLGKAVREFDAVGTIKAVNIVATICVMSAFAIGLYIHGSPNLSLFEILSLHPILTLIFSITLFMTIAGIYILKQAKKEHKRNEYNSNL